MGSRRGLGFVLFILERHRRWTRTTFCLDRILLNHLDTKALSFAPLGSKGLLRSSTQFLCGQVILFTEVKFRSCFNIFKDDWALSLHYK